MERLVQLIVLIGVSIFVYKTIRKFLGKVGGNLFKSFFIGSGEKYSICPDCNQRNGIDDIVNTKTISSKHEHERVNGKKDERYKKNDLVDKTEYTYKCKKCGNEFKSVRDEKRGSTSGILGQFVDLGLQSKRTGESIREYERKYPERQIPNFTGNGINYGISDEERQTLLRLKKEEEREKNYKLTGFKETDSERRTREKKEMKVFEKEIVKKRKERELEKEKKKRVNKELREKKSQQRLTQLIEKYGSETGELIHKGKVDLGMTTEMVIDSKGKPKDVIEKVSRGKKREEFFYDGYKNLQGNMSYKFRVVLIDGKVDGWNDITN